MSNTTTNPHSDQQQRYQRFVEHFLTHLNASEAARAAGYSGNSRQQGWRLLQREDVQEMLRKRRAELVEMGEIASPEEVLAGYTRDLRFDPRKLYDDTGAPLPVNELDEETALSLCGIRINETITESSDGSEMTCRRSYDYKLPDKKATRDSLGKHLGLFVERHALTDTDGNDVLTDLLDTISGATRGLPNTTQRKIRE